MDNKKKLVYAIAKYLRDEMRQNQDAESLEVAIQCLENAFEVSADDSSLDIGVSLPSVFNAIIEKIESERPVTTAEVKAEAEKWKNQGNERLREEKYQEAIDCYTRAIALDCRNPVYFCNRAAAHSLQSNHQAAVNDSKEALNIEPTYSKAYGRLGLAYTSLKQYAEAKEAYLKALEFEPDNETYRRNHDLNNELATTNTQANPNAPAPGLNVEGLTSMLGNQNLMAMASQMLSDPNMQHMLNNLMAGNSAPGGGGMDGLLQAGQRIAQMMQSSNPELVEQLRSQMGRPPGDQDGHQD